MTTRLLGPTGHGDLVPSLAVGEPHGIVGVTVTGSRPLGVVSFPVAAFSVLYGLNGAGKTTVLAAIERAVRPESFDYLPSEAVQSWYPPLSLSHPETVYLGRSGGVHVHWRSRPDAVLDDAFGDVLVQALEGRSPRLEAELHLYRLRGLPETPPPSLPTWAEIRPGLITRILRHAVWPNANADDAASLVDDGYWYCAADAHGLHLWICARPETTLSGWPEPTDELEQHEDTGDWCYATPPEQLPRLPLGLIHAASTYGVPVAYVGHARATDEPMMSLVTEQAADIDALTISSLYRRTRAGVGQKTVSSEGKPSEPLRRAAAELEDAASAVMASLFDDPPALRLWLGGADEWFNGRPPRWDAEWGSRFPISQLGDAHRRYARFAIGTALNPIHGPGLLGTIALIDEPERSLHRTAEVRLATGLGSIADTVVVATHSPLLLDKPDASLLHVHRGHRRILVDTLELGDLRRSGSGIRGGLGMAPHELFGLLRVAIVVEGIHDQAVITSFCQDVIDGVTVRVFPVYGTDGLQTIPDSTLLFDMTDASIIAVSDDGDSERLAPLRDAVARAKSRGAQHGKLRPYQRSESLGTRVLVELMRAAVDAGRLDRILVHPLKHKDIVRYIEPGLLGAQESWRELEQSFLDQCGRQRWQTGDGDRFKRFVNARYPGAYKFPRIRKAAERQAAAWIQSPTGLADGRPKEFATLAMRIRQLQRRAAG